MHSYSARQSVGPPAPRGPVARLRGGERLRVARRRQAELFRSVRAAVASLCGRTGAQAAQAWQGWIAGANGDAASQRGAGDADASGEVLLALDLNAPRAARMMLQGLGGGMRPEVLADAELIMSELVTNSVRHSGASPPESAQVRVWVTAAVVRVEVWDPGRDRAIAMRRPGLEAGGGLGLNLVRALSECWGFEQDAGRGTRVWAELAQAGSPAAVSASGG